MCSTFYFRNCGGRGKPVSTVRVCERWFWAASRKPQGTGVRSRTESNVPSRLLARGFTPPGYTPCVCKRGWAWNTCPACFVVGGGGAPTRMPGNTDQSKISRSTSYGPGPSGSALLIVTLQNLTTVRRGRCCDPILQVSHREV